MNNPWQPIQTVPLDGTVIDLWHITAGRMVDVWYVEEDKCFSCGLELGDFSHWMPQPPYPTAKNEWLPIETAPKDGRLLLLGWWAWWPKQEWCYEVAPAGNIDVARPGRGSLHGYATHWMPLPAPPPKCETDAKPEDF